LRDAGVLEGRPASARVGRLSAEQAEVARRRGQLDKAQRRLARTESRHRTQIPALIERLRARNRIRCPGRGNEREVFTTIDGTPRVVQADRGMSMTSKTVAALLADVGVTRSHSRPRVSNQNPFFEAWFKTLKYAPVFPDRFGSLQHARSFLDEFIQHYNHDHHHSGIGLHTPADVHYGLAADTTPVAFRPWLRPGRRRRTGSAATSIRRSSNYKSPLGSTRPSPRPKFKNRSRSPQPHNPRWPQPP
jgi:transposase InsO family protein